MRLFDLLRIYLPDINESECKIHLAGWNGSENPVDVFLAGDLKEWQSWQTKKNFERKYVITLLQLPSGNKWLFADGYYSSGCEYIEKEEYYRYRTSEICNFQELSGRLILEFTRSGRQSYLNAENWTDEILVSELMPVKMAIEDFAGYSRVLLSKKKLKIIITQGIVSWRTALSNVSGIYLITDINTGKFYVGSATGEGGIWQRWTAYADNGHGGNRELQALLSEKGNDYSNHFQYSILEIADTHSSPTDVLARESYWKDVLCSRKHGYNAN